MLGSAVFRTGVAPGGALAPGWVKNELWRKARAVPSLDLRFAENKSLVDATTGAQLVTFTRASSGKFVGSDGVLRTAVTNLQTWSEDFRNTADAGATRPWTYNTSAVTADNTIAPNGTSTADLIAGAAGTANKFLSNNISTTTTGFYTFSLYLKQSTEQFVVVRLSDGSANGIRGRFDLTAGTVVVSNEGTATGQAASATAVGNGWYRCVVTCSVSSLPGSVMQPQLWLNNFASTSLTTNYFAWGAQLEQSSTVGEYIPTTSAINSAPRFNHDPTTGESLGLLVEEQRTNSIVNSNSMTAVVAGSPGTLPTGWTAQGNTNGWTREVVGSGSIGALNYVDIRFSGTPTNSQFSTIFQSQGVAAASNGQSWAASVYHQLVGGSLSNVIGYPAANLWNSSSGYLSGLGLPSSLIPTSSLQRYSGSGTISQVNTAFISWGITFVCTIGNTYDFTIRFAGPQLELGAFATSYIATTTATVTRAADVASITGSNFSSWYNQTEGTVFANVTLTRPPSTVGVNILGIGDGTNSNRVQLNSGSSSAGNINGVVTTGGVAQAQPLVGSISSVGPHKIGFGYATNSVQIGVNGSLGTEDTSATMPSTITAAYLANGANPIAPASMTFARLTFWPPRLSNEVLQRITQP